MTDVLVAGGGPAGRALAGACARRGLSVTVVDPDPHRKWQNTYGLWADEVPHLPERAIAAAPAATKAFGAREHRLDRGYWVLDNTGLREWLAEPQVQVVSGKVASAEHGPRGSTAVLADGRRLAAAVYVNASGAPRGRTEQTAYGLVLPAEQAERLEPGAAGTAVFMDWRDGTQSFRYLLPLGDGTVLVEETSLAHRPGVPIAELAQRLHARLAAAGIRAAGRVERVRITLDVPLPVRGQAVPFGAAGGLVHPATGYSLATALQLAPPVAAALAGAFDAGPQAAARAARKALWPPEARAVHALRRHGLRALCGMSPAQSAQFFDLFFALPVPAQRAYTSGRADLAGTASAMANLFRAAPSGIRRKLLG
ncbi:lycopene cyclase family protein [Amycolatopsis benzoatilytica]|uniref:lycopene cyclase family protein n=1 Tax=Amycolatopsis benzoatilytica TaxID=346045 RepID=UPI0003757270|nr:lycopene cyclase family protein [Amycolatopsis benzoatilytica]